MANNDNITAGPMKMAKPYLDEKLAGRKFEAIVIGASAGGISALLALLVSLPAHFRIPIIIVLHMPDTRESRLVEVFQHHMEITVMLAEDKDRIQERRVYFAGPGYHLSIERDRSFSISCEEPLHFSRPSIDILMCSAADVYGTRLIGILLTGANQDGAIGMKSIHAAGGVTIIQDPAQAEIAVMPQSALHLFAPDYILPLEDIQALIFKLEKC